MIADPKAIASAGWSVRAHSLKSADLDDDFLPAKIAIIERTIPRSRNRVRHTMNGALIAISDYTPTLTEKVIAASQRIRRIEVDHGQTECKTPDATPSLRKMAVRAGGKRA